MVSEQGSESTTMAVNLVIPYTHPLYLHPSDTPGSVICPVKLTRSENYGLWRRSMLSFASEEEVSFCDGNL